MKFFEQGDPGGDLIREQIERLKGELQRRQERDIVSMLLAPGDPSPFFHWPAPAVEVEPDPAEPLRLFVGWRDMPIMRPKHSVMLITDAGGYVGPPELRCGTYTTPSGRTWAVVRHRDTGRREVVDWPLSEAALA